MGIKESRSILVIPVNILANSDETVVCKLVQFINRGYDKNRLKYKVITSQRIKDATNFYGDLGFEKNQQRCHLFLSVADPSQISPQFHQIFAELTLDFSSTQRWYVPIQPYLDTTIEFGSAAASVGFKPVDAQDTCFEVTGFTSFEPGAGKELLQATAEYYKIQIKAKKLVASVIVEHGLLEYYQKIHGFKEIDRQLVKKDLVSEIFEDNVVALRDFTVAKLIRDF